MLKIQQKNKNWHDLVLARAFEITFTSEWVYIPMKYIMEIKEGASIEDYLESYQPSFYLKGESFGSPFLFV